MEMLEVCLCLNLDIGYRLDRLQLYYANLHVNILIVDYRGYGSSTGVPSENGLKLDGEAVMDYARKCEYIDTSKLILFGKSLGGAVAIYLGEKYQTEVCALILENTFINIESMIDQHMAHLKYVKYLILRNHWNSLEKIERIKRPVLFIYGENDEIIDNRNMLTLYKNATKSIYKKLYMVPNGDHNMCYVYGKILYLNVIKDFIEKVIVEYPLKEFKEIIGTVTNTSHLKAD